MAADETCTKANIEAINNVARIKAPRGNHIQSRNPSVKSGDSRDRVLKMRCPWAASLFGSWGGRRKRQGGASAVVRGARLVVLKKRSHRRRAPREVLCADGVRRFR